MGSRAGYEVWRERREELSRGVEEIGVRWGLPGDEGRIAELLELSGKPRWVAFEERFIVAVGWDGEILAALRYRTVSKKLLLGLFVADPWMGERPLARALYAGVGALAREIGVKEVLARAVLYGEYPREAGYHRWARLWRLDVTRSPESFGELPASGWRRVLGLLSVVAIPFFRIFPEKTL
jgi:hypothetical protein